MPVNQLMADRPSVRDSIIDLVASWGALADPHLASLLDSLQRRSDPAGSLALIRAGAHDFLPAELREEIDSTLAVLRAGGTASAPSFRARLVRLVELAGDALRPAHEAVRLELQRLLEERWAALDDEAITASLEALWADPTDSSLAGRIGAFGRVRSATEQLRAESQGEGRVHPASAPAGAPGTAGSGSPAQAKSLESRLAAIIEGVERSTGVPPATTGPGEGRASLLGQAAGRLRPDLVRTAGGPEADALLRIWEEEILPELGGRAKREHEQAERRVALASALKGLAPDTPAGSEAASSATAAREHALTGGPAFYDAVRHCSERLVEAERGSAKAVEAAGGRLREAARELEAVLEKGAAHMPTARVVDSRLLLEQASGILRSARLEEIEAHSGAIRERVGAAKKLSEVGRATTQKREEQAREELGAEIRRLAAIAPRARARALARLEADLGQPGRAFDPQRARADIDRIAVAIEQDLRLPAARAHADARVWLKRRGQGSRGAAGAADGLRAASEALATALAGDDLEEIRDQAAIVRDLHLRASPWRRPAVRRAAAGGGVLLAAGLLTAWILFQGRTQAVRLDLPGDWKTVWVVRDGHLVEKSDRRATETTPEFQLPPGRYEVYVDARYTGRWFTVPGDPVIRDIIPPRPRESAGLTGADDEHITPR